MRSVRKRSLFCTSAGNTLAERKSHVEPFLEMIAFRDMDALFDRAERLLVYAGRALVGLWAQTAVGLRSPFSAIVTSNKYHLIDRY